MRRLAFGLSVALSFVSCAALAQLATPIKFLSNGTNLPTLVLNRANSGEISHIVVANTNTTPAFLKLYDQGTVPTCGTGTPVQTILIATSSAFAVPLNNNLKFLNGIAFCLTSLIADSDTSTVSTGVVIDLGIK